MIHKGMSEWSRDWKQQLWHVETPNEISCGRTNTIIGICVSKMCVFVFAVVTLKLVEIVRDSFDAQIMS